MAPPSSHPRHSTPPASSDETTPRSEDEDGGVCTDVFADFDIQSDSDRAFLRAHLREAPKEDVTFLLNTRKTPQKATPVQTKPVPSTPLSQTSNILPSTPRSLLKYHQRATIIAEFATKHAAESIPGIPNTNQLASFLVEVQTFATGLGLGPNQAQFEAKHAQEELCKANGIKLESKLAALEMPGLELTDAIEVLASVQQTVGNLFSGSRAPQDTGAAQNATPTKRKRFRKEANTPKVESDIGGTPLSATPTTDNQPEKVMLNDRRSKRQKANIAAVAAATDFAKLNPGAPKLSRKERKKLFIENKSKEASANTPPVAPTTVISSTVPSDSALAKPDPEAPKLNRKERKKAFIENKAKQASANIPPVAPTTVIAATVASESELAKPSPEAPKLNRKERKKAFIENKAKQASANIPPGAPTTVIADTIASDSELAKLSPEAPKLGRKERKTAFLENKAKQASANTPPAAPPTIIAASGTQAGPATNTQIPQVETKENVAVPVIPPASFLDLSGNKSKKILRKEERKTRRASERQATGVESPSVAEGDRPAPPKPIITAPTEQIDAADLPTPTTINADNEVATEKSSKKRKRGAKKPNPGPGESASAETAANTPKLADTANSSKSKVAASILPSAVRPPPVAVPNAAKPVVAADDGFIDLRAPKKKKRARKSTTAADGGSNSNSSEVVESEVITKQEAQTPVKIENTEPEAVAKPVVKEEVNDADPGMNTAGKRKRKRNAQQAKKAIDANEQIPTVTAVAVTVPEPMELCVEEPATKPIAESIILTAQPLSEISAPNPVSNKRRKRGNRKSVGDENKTEALVTVGELKEHHS